MIVTDITTASTELPVSLDEAKKQCRVVENDEDTLIKTYIQAACDYVSTIQGRTLLTSTGNMVLPEFSEKMVLTTSPVQSVTSITYKDENGDTQTLSTDVYGVDLTNEPAEVYLKYNQSFPSTLPERDAVTINMTVGYTSPEVVPASTRAAILWLTGLMYDERTPVVTGLIVQKIPQFDALVEADAVPYYST